MLEFEKPNGEFVDQHFTIYDGNTGSCDGGGVNENGTQNTRCYNELMFDSQSLSGIWRIKLISIEDAPGNLEYVTASDMDALGISRTFEVSGGVVDFDLQSSTASIFTPEMLLTFLRVLRASPLT